MVQRILRSGDIFYYTTGRHTLSWNEEGGVTITNNSLKNYRNFHLNEETLKLFANIVIKLREEYESGEYRKAGKGKPGPHSSSG